MDYRSQPLKISFTLSAETVRSLFDFIAQACGVDIEERKAKHRVDVSQQAIFGQDKAPKDLNLLVTRAEAAKLLRVSTRTIDKMNADGQMPKPIRIGRAVRWNRSELTAWAEAGCSSIMNHTTAAKASKVAETRTAYQRPKRSNTAGTVPQKGTSNLKARRRSVADSKASLASKPSPFEQLVREIGLDYEKMPGFTNGQVRELAETDIPTIHRWTYLGGSLPSETLELMKQKLLAKYPLEQFGIRQKVEGRVKP